MSALRLLKYVRSFSDGRVRIRHPALQREDVVATERFGTDSLRQHAAAAGTAFGRRRSLGGLSGCGAGGGPPGADSSGLLSQP